MMKTLSIIVIVGIFLPLCVCSCSHDVDIKGVWTQHIDNKDLSLSGDETYLFADNDSLTVTALYKFFQEDENFKCSYTFETSYKAYVIIDNDNLKFEYLPGSFVFNPKNQTFEINMKRDGDKTLFDSLKLEMRDNLVNFFKEQMTASFDSLCSENRLFNIRYVNDESIRLTSGDYEIHLRQAKLQR